MLKFQAVFCFFGLSGDFRIEIQVDEASKARPIAETLAKRLDAEFMYLDEIED